MNKHVNTAGPGETGLLDLLTWIHRVEIESLIGPRRRPHAAAALIEPQGPFFVGWR
jgi:hypothetical protein